MTRIPTLKNNMIKVVCFTTALLSDSFWWFLLTAHPGQIMKEKVLTVYYSTRADQDTTRTWPHGNPTETPRKPHGNEK